MPLALKDYWKQELQRVVGKNIDKENEDGSLNRKLNVNELLVYMRNTTFRGVPATVENIERELVNRGKNDAVTLFIKEMKRYNFEVDLIFALLKTEMRDVAEKLIDGYCYTILDDDSRTQKENEVVDLIWETTGLIPKDSPPKYEKVAFAQVPSPQVRPVPEPLKQKIRIQTKSPVRGETVWNNLDTNSPNSNESFPVYNRATQSKEYLSDSNNISNYSPTMTSVDQNNVAGSSFGTSTPSTGADSFSIDSDQSNPIASGKLLTRTEFCGNPLLVPNKNTNIDTKSIKSATIEISSDEGKTTNTDTTVPKDVFGSESNDHDDILLINFDSNVNKTAPFIPDNVSPTNAGLLNKLDDINGGVLTASSHENTRSMMAKSTDDSQYYGDNSNFKTAQYECTMKKNSSNNSDRKVSSIHTDELQFSHTDPNTLKQNNYGNNISILEGHHMEQMNVENMKKNEGQCEGVLDNVSTGPNSGIMNNSTFFFIAYATVNLFFAYLCHKK